MKKEKQEEREWDEMTLMEKVEYAEGRAEYAKKRAAFSDRLSNVALVVAIFQLAIAVLLSFIK